MIYYPYNLCWWISTLLNPLRDLVLCSCYPLTCLRLLCRCLVSLRVHFRHVVVALILHACRRIDMLVQLLIHMALRDVSARRSSRWCFPTALGSRLLSRGTKVRCMSLDHFLLIVYLKPHFVHDLLFAVASSLHIPHCAKWVFVVQSFTWLLFSVSFLPGTRVFWI